MGYYFRVFCTTDVVPPLADVLQWVQKQGVPVTANPAGATWGTSPLHIQYADGAPPFAAELNRRDGDESLATQEITEYIRLVEALRKSRKRDTVLDHLKKTRFVVACEIPVDKNFDDAGFHALDVFLAYFVSQSEGMVQADGQGFYDMGKLIVELED